MFATNAGFRYAVRKCSSLFRPTADWICCRDISLTTARNRRSTSPAASLPPTVGTSARGARASGSQSDRRSSSVSKAGQASHLPPFPSKFSVYSWSDLQSSQRENRAQNPLDGAVGKVRKFPHEPARTRGGARQPTKKSPTRTSWGLCTSGAGGNRTRVRKSSKDSSTYLVD